MIKRNYPYESWQYAEGRDLANLIENRIRIDRLAGIGANAEFGNLHITKLELMQSILWERIRIVEARNRVIRAGGTPSLPQPNSDDIHISIAAD